MSVTIHLIRSTERYVSFKIIQSNTSAGIALSELSCLTHVCITRWDLCPRSVFVFDPEWMIVEILIEIKTKFSRILVDQSKLVAPEEGLVSK